MRASLLVLAGILAAGGAMAASHLAPADNGTSFPEPEESAERGPLDDDAISWFPTGLVLLVMTLGAAVFLMADRWTRPRP